MEVYLVFWISKQSQKMKAKLQIVWTSRQNWNLRVDKITASRETFTG